MEDFNLQNKKENIQQNLLNYADFFSRLAAFIFDILIFLILYFILRSIIKNEKTADYILTGAFFSYNIILIKKYQQTLGKKIFNLKIESDDPNNPDLKWGKVILRETLGKILSGLFFGLGYFYIFFKPKRQAFHDVLAKTVVIETKKPVLSQKILKIFLIFLIILLPLIQLVLIFIVFFRFITEEKKITLIESIEEKIKVVNLINNCPEKTAFESKLNQICQKKFDKRNNHCLFNQLNLKKLKLINEELENTITKCAKYR